MPPLPAARRRRRLSATRNRGWRDRIAARTLRVLWTIRLCQLARARGLRPASPVLVWTAILILYVVWGSTYLGIRVAVDTIPPFLMAAVRFAIAGTVMLAAVAVFRRGTAARPTRREWRDSFIVGTCLMGGGMGAVAWGELTVPSGIAGILIAMLPVWVAVFGRVFLGERLPGLAIVGIAAGVLGVVILVGPGWRSTARSTRPGSLP